MKTNDSPLINHITINTGNNYPIPRDKMRSLVVETLRPLVIAGGGVIPKGNGRYHFLLNSRNPRSCMFSVWGRKNPLLFCGYQEPCKESVELWNSLIQMHMTIYGLCPKAVHKPAEPWLGVVLCPAALSAFGDLFWLAEFEQYIAETWRQLSTTKRSPIPWSSSIAELVGMAA